MYMLPMAWTCLSVLNIHRGDRMKTLVSMDTKAVNGPAYIKKQTGEEVTDFQNGDQTSTTDSHRER